MARGEFGTEVRKLVYERAGGRCERCGLASMAYQWHHRRPRAMGGSNAADTNTAANCLLLCVRCHQAVESQRAVALDRGYLVPQGATPTNVPVYRCGGWVLLDNYGGTAPHREGP